MPIYLVWEAFGGKNGAATESEMVARIQRYRGERIEVAHDEIGCTILTGPTFLARDQWIPPPEDWAPNIVQGKTYSDETPIGARVWGAFQAATSGSAPDAVADVRARFGAPGLIARRLGQGEFRIAVTDAYHRRCAITSERTLPALDAAHIRPYSLHGEHRVDNGLLLRKDLHALFDAGYVTVRPDLRVLVSRRIREDYENGRDYYAMAGRMLQVPDDPRYQPNATFLDWHSSERFLG
ncbi:MAG: HNH endonuclease [Candidatus Limnocylindria bacterium]